MATYILYVENSGPQLTGQPSVENDSRRGFPRWWVSYVPGHISTRLPIIYLIFRPYGIELLLLIEWFDEILRCLDAWAKKSAGVVYGSFRLYPFSVLGNDVMYLSEVCNSTGWRFDGFAGGGAGGAMKIGICMGMGRCLRSLPMVPSLSSFAAWSEYDKYEIMLVIFIVTCTLWSVFRIWMTFCVKVTWSSTRKFVKHILHMNVYMKYDVSLTCLYFLFSPALTAWTWSGLLIDLSNILIMCLASSFVDLRWLFLQ